MSVKTNIKTELKQKDILVDALNKLNVSHSVHEAKENVAIKDYYNKDVTNKAEVKISKYVGFEKNSDGSFALVGDTHFEKGLFSNASTAVQKVTQVYQATQIALALEEDPKFSIESSNIDQAADADEIVIVANIQE